MKEEKKENKDEYIKDDSVKNKQKKQVTFDLDEDNGKDEENQNELQNQVAKALLILHEEAEVLEEEKIEEKTDTLTIEPVQIDGNNEAEDLRMKPSLDLPDDLVYIESGSDFEDNLTEKWKDIKKGTKLRR